MKIIAGLGNPGKRYRWTRHNLGFQVVDALSDRWSGSWKRSRFKGEIASCLFHDAEYLLVKPHTFMNRSGDCIAPLLYTYKCGPSDLLVLHDDLDLPFASLRIKRSGGDGGHRGVRSIIDSLEANDFVRFRLGIGRPAPETDPTDYVLDPWNREEREKLPQVIEHVLEAIESLLVEGVEAAMNRYHPKGSSAF